MKIAFLGLPLAAILLARDGHSVQLAGVRSVLSTGQRRLARMIGGDQIVTDPHENWDSFAQRAASLGAGLLVSWFFTRKIPETVLNAFPLGGIGVHPSLLPKYRGPDPFFAAIDAGETVSGVTAHRLANSYDSGAILAQEQLAIAPGSTAWQLARALDRPSLRLLRVWVKRAAQGDPLSGHPQDEAGASLAPRVTEEQRILYWHWPAEQVVRRVRALSPSPGALAWLVEEPLILLETEVRNDIPRALRPGEAAVVAGTAVVRAADYGVGLIRAELGDQLLDRRALAHLVAATRMK